MLTALLAMVLAVRLLTLPVAQAPDDGGGVSLCLGATVVSFGVENPAPGEDAPRFDPCPAFALAADIPPPATGPKLRSPALASAPAPVGEQITLPPQRRLAALPRAPPV